MMPLSLRVTATVLPLLVLLSQLWVSHADLLGGLAKLDPGKVVNTITKGNKLDPGKVVNAITKGHPQNLGSEVLHAGSTLANAGKEHVGAVVDAGPSKPQSGQASPVNSTEPTAVAATTAAPTAAAAAAAPAAAAPPSPAHSPADHLGHVAKDLTGVIPNNVRSDVEEGVKNILGGLRPVIPKIEEAIKHSGPAVQKVEQALSDPTKVKQIEGTLKDLAPKVADAIEKVDTEKVKRAEKVLEEANPAVDTVLSTIDSAEWWGSHWQLTLILVLGVCLAAVVCCQLKTEGATSSVLDAEMNQYLNAGSQRNSHVQLTEDACFRQF